MNFDVEKRTILTVRHGSHAYGLNTPTSDIDIKGVCIEPREYHLGFMHVFEQYERMNNVYGGDLPSLQSLKGTEVDLVVYSLKKFARLAADCNPNIIEVLHVADEDVLHINRWGETLRAHKDEFLSKKAKFTFAGYAHAQLKRIKTHKAWLLDPPKAPPNRKDFGLSETTKVSQSELGAFEAAVKDGIEIELPKDVLTLFTREKQYQAAKLHWDQYQNWVKTRNAKRAELEAKFGYDTKHGMHLLRLMRMCREIMLTGKVVVKRPDREELLAIRFGGMSYEELIQEAENLEAECEELYESSPLPRTPDREKLDRLIIEMTDEFLGLYG